VRALATASHGIAATFGYEDGENIPLDLHLDMVGRIAAAVDLPVSMDMEAGYGDAGETARRAIAAGVVGGNLEDQMKPLDEAVAAVEAVLRAGRDAGIDFVLNARTDAFVRAAGDADRGRARRRGDPPRPGLPGGRRAGRVRPAPGRPRGDRRGRRGPRAATG
jgi:2-methylisocitrate lyase-like PEP mutase family enzyme